MVVHQYGISCYYDSQCLASQINIHILGWAFFFDNILVGPCCQLVQMKWWEYQIDFSGYRASQESVRLEVFALRSSQFRRGILAERTLS